jgi:hypothetical protein
MGDPRRWRSKVINSTVSHVAGAPGLYVLGHIHFLEGLEVGREYIYAGRTDNMRRRLSEHTQLTEKNVPLQKYLRATKREVYVWYSTEFPLGEIARVEKTLIRDLNPKFNRIKYLRGEDE